MIMHISTVTTSTVCTCVKVMYGQHTTCIYNVHVVTCSSTPTTKLLPTPMTSIGHITDWQKAFSQLENLVHVQQEEIMSLHQMIEQLEKRLEPLEAKGELCDVNIQPVVLSLQIH